MTFLVVGINYQTASVSVREQLTFAPESLVPALHNVITQQGVEEAVILSTCNRTEIYIYGTITPKDLKTWLTRYHLMTLPPDDHHFYSYEQKQAIIHAMRVASGLDSLVLGEPQILGQLKSAYAVAHTAKTLGGPLEQMFQHTFHAAKKVRTNTAIGENPISVAYAAVQLASHIFTDLTKKTALLIGAGKTIELVYQHLRQNHTQYIFVANRTQERAWQLATHRESQAVLLGDIPDILHKADIVVASTASQLPILGKGAVENALKRRKHSPILMVDIALPRDIEPEVGELSDVYLYSVDDLHEVIKDNVNSRKKAADVAEQIIEKSSEDFTVKLRGRSAINTLKLYRQQVENLRQQELNKALRLIAAGKPLEEVLQQLANNLTNKLIHSPCVEIRKAGGNGDTKKLDWAKELLGLSTTEVLKNHERILN